MGHEKRDRERGGGGTNLVQQWVIAKEILGRERETERKR